MQASLFGRQADAVLRKCLQSLGDGDVEQAENLIRKWAIPENKTGNIGDGGILDLTAPILQQYCYLVSGHIWMRADYKVNNQSIFIETYFVCFLLYHCAASNKYMNLHSRN